LIARATENFSYSITPDTLRGSTSCNLNLIPGIHEPEDEIGTEEDFLDFSLIEAGIKGEA
jgi:hypothetical protein